MYTILIHNLVLVIFVAISWTIVNLFMKKFVFDIFDLLMISLLYLIFIIIDIIKGVI